MSPEVARMIWSRIPEETQRQIIDNLSSLVRQTDALLIQMGQRVADEAERIANEETR